MRALLLLLWTTPSLAHDGPGAFSVASLEPWITGPLLVACLLYAAGVRRLWRRAGAGTGLRRWRAGCFWTAAILLLAEFVSPLHTLAARYFVAHMGEHEILMIVAAPLFALSRPLAILLWGLPQRVRLTVARQTRWLKPVWRRLSEPAIATAVNAVAVWGWHVPLLFDAAVADAGVHALQHLSFLGSALLFWSALLDDRAFVRYGSAVLYLFFTSVHTSLLGAMLVFAPRTWYAPAAADTALAPLEDQQLAGLVMWVPGGLVYAIAALVLCYLWIARRARRPAWSRHATV